MKEDYGKSSKFRDLPPMCPSCSTIQIMGQRDRLSVARHINTPRLSAFCLLDTTPLSFFLPKSLCDQTMSTASGTPKLPRPLGCLFRVSFRNPHLGTNTSKTMADFVMRDMKNDRMNCTWSRRLELFPRHNPKS